MARILVIDDDAGARVVLSTGLKAQGHEVFLAEDGKAGINLQRHHTLDVVVTDIFMPEKDGLETIRELRAEYPRLGLIAISGGAKSVSPQHALSTARDMGAEILQKPFSIDILVKTVEKLLPQPVTAADLVMAVSEMEKILDETGQLDDARFVAAAEIILSQAPNEEVIALAQRILRGTDRFGRRSEPGQLERHLLRDRVFRLRVTLEALNRIGTILH